MSKKIKRSLPFLILILIITICLVRYFSSKTVFSDGYVPGNLAGNLYNGGLFCEYDGMIFFSNPNDGNTLYSMTRTGDDLTKLSDNVACYINADDHYLYYTRNNSGGNNGALSFLNIYRNSLCRINKNGKHELVLDDDPCMYATLIGNYIYYIHYDKKTASTLHRVKIDGSEAEQVSGQPIIPACTSDGYLYYSGVSGEHNIHRLNTINNTSSILYQDNCYQPIVNGNTIYYMDCENDYSIAKADLLTGEKTTIVPERVDTYNVYGEWIYYQRSGDNPALCRIKTDGTEFEVVSSGNYSNINITSSYVYFTAFNDKSTYYRTPTVGDINVSIFNPE